MKRFIIQLLIFVGILLGGILINISANYLIFQKTASPFQDSNILIAGDSHAKCGIDPAQFHDAYSTAQFAEPYVLTYWKLKFIFEHHQIDTLVLGFAPQNFSAFNDRKFSDPTWSEELFKRSLHIGEFRQLEGMEIDWDTYYKTFLKQMGLYPRRKAYTFTGGFTKRQNTLSVEPKERIEQHYFLDGEELGISQVSISYLDSILYLCQQKQIEPILVSTPVHPDYYAQIPAPFLETFDILKQQLSDQSITIFDYTSTFYEAADYYDMDHLNHQGAIKLTKTIHASLVNPLALPPR